MDSSAAADSGDCGCWAARTTDHRVGGKARGPAPVEVRLLMGACYPSLLPETRRLLQREGVCVDRLFEEWGVPKGVGASGRGAAPGGTEPRRAHDRLLQESR